MFVDPLIEYPWLGPIAFIALVFVGPVVGAALTSRRRLAWWLSGASCIPIAVITLFPQDRRIFERCAVEWSAPWPQRVELFGNVVLFIAPVLLATVATRRPIVAALVGSGVAAAIEVFQAAVPALGRSCDTNDWLSNSVGSIFGAALGWSGLRLARWQTSRSRAPVIQPQH